MSQAAASTSHWRSRRPPPLALLVTHREKVDLLGDGRRSALSARTLDWQRQHRMPLAISQLPELGLERAEAIPKEARLGDRAEVFVVGRKLHPILGERLHREFEREGFAPWLFARCVVGQLQIEVVLQPVDSVWLDFLPIAILTTCLLLVSFPAAIWLVCQALPQIDIGGEVGGDSLGGLGHHAGKGRMSRLVRRFSSQPAGQLDHIDSGCNSNMGQMRFALSNVAGAPESMTRVPCECIPSMPAWWRYTSRNTAVCSRWRAASKASMCSRGDGIAQPIQTGSA